MKDAKNTLSLNTYAIFQTGGKQYQAIPGKTLAIEKIQGNEGDTIQFAEVLFRKNAADSFEIGAPFIAGAAIKASILKHDRAPKVIVFKFKRRKKSRVKKGHRQPFSVIRVESI
jgi:large subunit ribosomal protein L21